MMTQNDLKSEQKKIEAAYALFPQTPLKFAHLPLGTPITRKEVDLIKLTAQFVVVYGNFFLEDLKKIVSTDPELGPHFGFLNMSTDGMGKLYFHCRLIDGYARVLLRSQRLTNYGTCTETVLAGFLNLVRQVLGKEEDEKGVDMAMIDFHAFQFFVNMEYNILPPPPLEPDTPVTTHDAEPISFPLLPQGITHKELVAIKLTAQFVAVYGMRFGQGLQKSVSMQPELEPHFQFMKSSDCRHSFYSQVTVVYMRVLQPSKTLDRRFLRYSTTLVEKCTSIETLLDGFYKLLHEVLKKDKEQGPEMAMVDVHAIQYFANVEMTHMSPELPGYLLVLKNPQPQMQPSPEEPDPKRQRLELVPEDQFLAQNPGSSAIRVSIPSLDDDQVVEITMQSLSENVASLKEKVANKLKFSGKAGLLEDDDKSLAHYNIRTGDTLTLSL
ncbi:unnamed protein product [Arabidopsis halleri]